MTEPMRREITTEERGEPSLIFLRSAGPKAPAELVIVEKGVTMVWPIRDGHVLRVVADGSNILWKRGSSA